jgi:hypothetical protein
METNQTNARHFVDKNVADLSSCVRIRKMAVENFAFRVVFNI